MFDSKNNEDINLTLIKLESKARYAGLLLAPSEDFGQNLFCILGKKGAFHTVYAY